MSLLLTLKQYCFLVLSGGKESTVASMPKYFVEKFKTLKCVPLDQKDCNSCWLDKELRIWKTVLPEDLFVGLVEFKESFYGTFLRDNFDRPFHGEGSLEVKRIRLVFDVVGTKEVYVDREWKLLERKTFTKTLEIDPKHDVSRVSYDHPYAMPATVKDRIVSRLAKVKEAKLRLKKKQKGGYVKASLKVNF